MESVMYRDRFEKATAHIAEHPDDPAGYYSLAISYEFGDEAVNAYRRALSLYLKDRKEIQDVTKESFLEATGAKEKIFFEKNDFDGDGSPEVLLGNLDGIHNWIAIIIDRIDSTWKIVDYEVTGEWFRSGRIEDLNGNGLPDILFDHYQGGRGSVGFKILEYSNGTFRLLGSDWSSIYSHRFGEITVGPAGEDGLKTIEITFYVDNFEDDSGTPYHRMEKYRWDGKMYSIIEDRRID
jgi:hypothetical protein